MREEGEEAAGAAPLHEPLRVPGDHRNLEDDIGLLDDCDLVIEAIIEDVKIKRRLFENVAKHRKPDAIVATNTSGLGIAPLVEGFDLEFRKHFLVMHSSTRRGSCGSSSS